MGDARLAEYVDAWLGHASAAAAQGGPELHRLLSLMSPDVRYEDVPSGAIFNGHEGIRKMCAAAHAWSNDVTMTVTSSQCDGRQFAIEVVASGTNTGSMDDAPATGRSFSYPMASIGAFGPDGLVVEHRDYWDLLSFLKQIGLLKSRAPHEESGFES